MNSPPSPPPFTRRLTPRLHHAAGFIILLVLLLVSISHPSRLERTAHAGHPGCQVEIRYPARMAFAETETIEARISAEAGCSEPSLELTPRYLDHFRQVTMLTTKVLPASRGDTGEGRPNLVHLRMELMAARSLLAEGTVNVRCGAQTCATFAVSTFVFP
jgi:hypothetical protein